LPTAPYPLSLHDALPIWPVLDDIRQFAPATLELATISFVLSLVIGIPLGIVAAVKRDSWIDHAARLVSLIGVSSPTFWLAFIMRSEEHTSELQSRSDLVC